MPAADPTTPPRLIALGELLVDITPHTPGASLEDDTLLRPAAGGAPANVAVAATRLGAPSVFVGTVGDDPFGRRLRRELAATGVDVAAVATVTEPTAVAFVALRGDGEREFSFYGRPAAHDMLRPAHVDAAFALRPLRAHDVLHLGSNSLAREPARAASVRAVEHARAAGAAVSFDLNLRPALWDTFEREAVLATLTPLLAAARLVKLSLDELAFVTCDDEPGLDVAARTARAWLDDSAELVSVTLGARGVWTFTRSGSAQHAGFVVEAVDTTGAGDAYAGAIAAAHLAAPATWRDTDATAAAVSRACAYAALSTTRHGAIPAYGDERELAAFLGRTRRSQSA